MNRCVEFNYQDISTLIQFWRKDKESLITILG